MTMPMGFLSLGEIHSTWLNNRQPRPCLSIETHRRPSPPNRQTMFSHVDHVDNEEQKLESLSPRLSADGASEIENVDIIDKNISSHADSTTMTVSSSPTCTSSKPRKRFGTMLVLGMFCVGYAMLADPSGAPSDRDLTNGRTAAGRKFRKLSPGTPNFALWGQMLGGDQKLFADLANKVPTTNDHSNNHDGNSRDLFGISFLASPENGPECRVPPALPPPQPIAPTFAASYPGSGAKMSWNLITGLTGVQTGDDWLLNGIEWNQAVTVKTHYPHPEGNPDIGKLFTSNNLKGAFPRAVIILRHPLHAIPGYHNYLYEAEKGLAGHSKRAPVSEWIKWRDVHFTTEMDNWIHHINFWSGRYGSAEGGVSSAGKVERQIVTYEGLVSDTHGPAGALALAKFLDNTVGVDVTTDPSTVSCLWQKVIKYKGQSTAPESGTRDILSERSGSSFRPYSMKQYDYMITSLRDLLSSHHEDNQLRPVLESYIAESELAKAMREEELAKIKAEQQVEAAEPETTQPELAINLLQQEPAV